MGSSTPVDKHGLAVEDIDIRVRYLAMDQQRHPCFGHAFEHRVDLLDIGDAVVGIGRRAGGIEFDGGDHAAFEAGNDILGIRVFGQIKSHQRREAVALRNGLQDTLAVSSRHFGIGHRRNQIGHDDGSGKVSGAVRRSGFQHLGVTKMKMPVVRTADHEFLHGRSNLCLRPNRTFQRFRYKEFRARASARQCLIVNCRRSVLGLDQRAISLDHLMAADRLHSARRVAQRDAVHRASVATPPMGRYAATLRAGRFWPLASLACTCGGVAPRRAIRLAETKIATVKWCKLIAL